jgi:ABC-type phosphate transport system permease subunit
MSQGTSLSLAVYGFSQNAPDEAAAAAVILVIFVVGLNLLATALGKLLSKNRIGAPIIKKKKKREN